MKTYVVSTERLTGLVQVSDKGFIVSTAPCFAKYRGQRWERMLEWQRKGLFGCRIAEITPSDAVLEAKAQAEKQV